MKFINDDDFKKHVFDYAKRYVDSSKQKDLKEFNKNNVDPIKMLFDRTMTNNEGWIEIIEREILRQTDKTRTNLIGYFHQNIFKYIDNCEVPEKGFDIIYNDGKKKYYVEMKNKHNTMNSSSSESTYKRMLKKINEDENAICFLVEVIASKSQNITWIKEGYAGDERIRRVSVDQFYKIVTGEDDAFSQILDALEENLLALGGKAELKAEGLVNGIMNDLNELNDSEYEALRELAFKTYLSKKQ